MTYETERQLTSEIAELRGDFRAFLRQYADDSRRTQEALLQVGEQVCARALCRGPHVESTGEIKAFRLLTTCRPKLVD